MNIILGEHKLYLIIGEQRVGKTKWLIKNIIKPLPEKVPVVVFNPANEELWLENFKERNQFYDISQMTFEDDLGSGLKKKYHAAINNYIKNMIKKKIYNVVVVDDSRPLLSNNQSESMFSLLSFRRQMKSDMFFVFHTLRSVPSDFYGYADYIILFRTVENPFYYEEKMPEDLRKKIEAIDIANLERPVLIDVKPNRKRMEI